MGGKYKKFLRSEKAKVKLKGAKLPKGLNITKTEFKIRKITIKEQLAETTLQGRKEENVKEILTRLKHHNSSFRMSAIKSLKDLINKNTVAVYRHLGQIIQGISSNCLDIDTDVRRESFKVMSILFTLLGVDTIRPFFDVISSYLRCAMTHIQASIQEDALLFLDVLMKYIPNLVAEDGDAIFVNFLDMISKLKEDHKQGRALTMNLSRTKTTKWRIKVLQRLHGMLNIVLEDRKRSQFFVEGNPYQDLTFRFNYNEKMYLCLKNAYQKQPVHLNIFKNTSSDYKIDQNNEGEQIKYYINILMPILFDLWIEVRPYSNHPEKSDEKLPLSTEGAYTLGNVLDIFQCLWQLVHLWEKKAHNNDISDIYQKSYGENFIAHFFKAFPYQQSEVGKFSKKDKRSMNTDDPYCLQHNLLLSYLFCTFFSKNVERHREIAHQILEFLTETLNTIENGRAGNIIHLQKTLRAIIYENGENFMKMDSGIMRQLLRQVLSIHKQKRNKEFNETILVLLCDVVLEDHLYQIYGQFAFQEWLIALPKLLCQQHVSRHTLKTLSNLAKRKNKIFLESLRLSYNEIIGALSMVNFVGYEDQEEGKNSVHDLLYWVREDTRITN